MDYKKKYDWQGQYASCSAAATLRKVSLRGVLCQNKQRVLRTLHQVNITLRKSSKCVRSKCDMMHVWYMN